jgi:hypothetical protein
VRLGGSCNAKNATGSRSGRPDLNRGPLEPHSSALPGCATPRSFTRHYRFPTAEPANGARPPSSPVAPRGLCARVPRALPLRPGCAGTPQRQAEGDALSSAIGAAKVHWQRRESPRAKRTGRLGSPWERGSMAFSDFVGRRFSPPLVHLSVPPHYGRPLLHSRNMPHLAAAVGANHGWRPLCLPGRHSQPPRPLAAKALRPPTWQLREVFPPTRPQELGQTSGRAGGKDQSLARRNWGHERWMCKRQHLCPAHWPPRAAVQKAVLAESACWPHSLRYCWSVRSYQSTLAVFVALERLPHPPAPHKRSQAAGCPGGRALPLGRTRCPGAEKGGRVGSSSQQHKCGHCAVGATGIAPRKAGRRSAAA